MDLWNLEVLTQAGYGQSEFLAVFRHCAACDVVAFGREGGAQCLVAERCALVYLSYDVFYVLSDFMR